MEPNPRRPWQVERKSVKQRLSYLLNSGAFLDCSFLVGPEPQQVVVMAHKLILAMASPAFESMFYGDLANGDGPIRIVDIQPRTFREVLCYIYTDEVRISCFNMGCQLWYAGRRFVLPFLIRDCLQYLWTNLTPENVCRGYEFAVRLKENAFREKCLHMIRTNTKEVLAHRSFQEVDISTIVAVFSQEHLTVDSELDLFRAAERYARAQRKRRVARAPPALNPPAPRSPTASNNDEDVNVINLDSSPDEPCPANPQPWRANTEPRREELQPGSSGHSARQPAESREDLTIRSAIEQIRFLTLSAKQFAQLTNSPLLTSSDVFSVFTILSSRNAPVPMPPGFSASRETRRPPAPAPRSQPSVTNPFVNYINEQFYLRDMFTTFTYQVNCYHCNRDVATWNRDYCMHLMCFCSRFMQQRIDYEIICRAFNVEPYSTEVITNRDAIVALHVLIDYIERETKPYI